jgi:hypothetical protein
MDGTKCSGKDCPVKEKCYRFTAEASERQSYFFKPPFEIKDDLVICEMYWGQNAENIWKQLKDITDDK